DPEHGMWARLARAIMARPLAFLAGGAAVLVAAAVPAFSLRLTPGSTFGIPRTPQAIRGFDVLRKAVGPGAVAPSQALVAAPARSVRVPPQAAPAPRPYVYPPREYEQVTLAGRHDYGFPQEQAFVHRLRDKLIPAA